MLFLWNHITVSSAAAIRALSMKFPLSQILSLGDPNLSALGAPLEEQQLLKKPPVLLSPDPPCHGHNMDLSLHEPEQHTSPWIWEISHRNSFPPNIYFHDPTGQTAQDVFSVASSQSNPRILGIFLGAEVLGEQCRTWPKVCGEHPPSTSAGLPLEIYYGQKQLLEDCSSPVGADG